MIEDYAMFDYYASLPPRARSYGRVAARFGLSRTAVARRGKRGQWPARARARDAATGDLEDGADRDARHLIALRLVQETAMRAITEQPDSPLAAAGLGALPVAVEAERAIRQGSEETLDE